LHSQPRKVIEDDLDFSTICLVQCQRTPSHDD
jgi:hypothetical protein